MRFILMAIIFVCISWILKDGGKIYYYVALSFYIMATILLALGVVQIISQVVPLFL